jgi:hypothetical protein
VPETLKRAMCLRESAGHDRLEPWHEQVVSEIHERVPALVAEAWAVRFMSPQASVALLRTAAELIATTQGARRGVTLNKTLANLEAAWEADPPDKTPLGRRESTRRATVLSCFHTVRDLGNRIHADSAVSSQDVELAHHATRRLIEAVLRLGPLD